MSKRDLRILHNNGAIRILHFLAGRGETGAHLTEFGQACNLSYGTVSVYLSALKNGHFNPSITGILHRAGWTGDDFRPLVENVRGAGLYRISPAGRDFLASQRFGWAWK